MASQMHRVSKVSKIQAVSPRKQNARLVEAAPRASTITGPSNLPMLTPAVPSDAAAAPAQTQTVYTNRVGNPQVRAIQSRVADLVRRYDEVAGAADMDDDDDDDDRLSVPSRWKVGDVLLATHSALSKTSSRAEHTMNSEFADDPESMELMGDGQQQFAIVLHDASERSKHLQEVLAKSLAMVQNMQLSDQASRLGDARVSGERQQQARDLKITIEALRKEKTMAMSQLAEQARALKETMTTMDEQNQELKRCQIALGAKCDEVKQAKEEGEWRLSELQKTFDTTQITLQSWREKHQAVVKSSGVLEQKAMELEKKLQAQTEELKQHDFILQAKNQEVERHKERLKDAEAMRAKAETALKEASHDNARARRNNHDGEEFKATVAKEKQELETRVEQARSIIEDLKAQLREANASKNHFENDNSALAKLVREMQERARQALPPNDGLQLPPMLGRSLGGFALSFRQTTMRKRQNAVKTVHEEVSPKDDDLSTTSSDEDTEAEQDEMELNDTVQKVVKAVFPVRRANSETDESIRDNIANYEDPQEDAFHQPAAAPPEPETSGAEQQVTVPLTELQQMRRTCDQELARMKDQYVSGLIEYKRLVIEQYERRQAEIRERHRVQVENLIMFVQEKFRKEMERHGEKMLRAKESLKMLYRAMKSQQKSSSMGSGSESRHQDAQANEAEGNVPLKSLMRAAVFAMSTSHRRNDKATTEINGIYERVKNNQSRTRSVHAAPALVAPLSQVVVMSKPPTPQPVSAHPPSPVERVAPVLMIHVGCQVEENDFVIFNLRGFRGSAVSPECMDDYVLPSKGLLGYHRQSSAKHHHQGSATASPYVMHLMEGAVFSDQVVAELRGMMPLLPPGAYYLSSALKYRLLLELMRFYSDYDARKRASVAMGEARETESTSEFDVIVGSPRDTPFMRRKAQENAEKHKVRQRRQLLTSGGLAVMQPIGL